MPEVEVKELTKCSHCDEEINPDNNTENVVNGDTFCDNCFNELFTYCSHCNIVIPIDESYYQDDNTYCQDCYDEIYTTCDSCGETVSRRDSGTSRGNTYCQHCYDSQNNAIHNYEYKPSPIFHTLNNNKLYLGIELEIDKGDDKQDCADALKSLSDDEDLFYLKEDGSLDNGIEIVSHPSTLEYHKKFFNWNNIFNTARRYNFLSHDAKTCGLHIHIPKRFLTYSEAIKIGLFVNLNEREVEIIARRRSDNYAAFKKVKKLKDAGYSNGRYEAVNFTNRTTIEFRMFKGTLKSNTFFASLEFVDGLVSFVKTVNTQQVVKNGFNLYLDYILSNKKQYKILIEYLKTKNLIKEDLKKCA